MTRRLGIELAVLAAVAVAAVAIRSRVAELYVIPSESMMPRLMVGDYPIVERWPYRHRGPRRGDVVVFHAPPSGARDYVKRVIGLPGDRVALRHGALVLNGAPVPRWRVADLLLPATGGRCVVGTLEREAGGGIACRAARWRELPPGGPIIDTLDLGATDADEFGPVTVPPGRLFLLGDNRDRSADSRVAPEAGGIGMVPMTALVGRVGPLLLSVDGTARLRDPRGWWRAVRWRRVGTRF